MDAIKNETAQNEANELLKRLPPGTQAAVVIWNDKIISFGSVDNVPEVVKKLAHVIMCLVDMAAKRAANLAEVIRA